MSVLKSKTTLMVTLIGSLGLSGFAGYWLGHQSNMSAPVKSAATVTLAPKPAEPKVLYWYDPMKPDQHFDKPGKSPYMDMDLVPKYAEAPANNNESTDPKAEQAMGVRIDPALTQNLGVRIVPVEQGQLENTLRVTGAVQFNDRQVAVVQTRSAGFVEKAYPHAPGDVIAKGAPLADLLVPEWSAAQTELLATIHIGDASLIQAAKQRLALLGMPQGLIDQVAKTGKVQATTTLRAPISGVISALDVRPGMSLSAGQTLAKINGLDSVWVEAAVPESSADNVHMGSPVKLSFTAFPDQQFTGTVSAILPDVNADSHTIRVRIELANPHGQLRPGMYAQVTLSHGASGAQLLVPEEAVFRTGTRNVVILSVGHGHFQPANVTLGASANGKVAVLSGLTADDKVVASGQFLIDSEASLQGVMARMNDGATAAMPGHDMTDAETHGMQP